MVMHLYQPNAGLIKGLTLCHQVANRRVVFARFVPFVWALLCLRMKIDGLLKKSRC